MTNDKTEIVHQDGVFVYKMTKVARPQHLWTDVYRYTFKRILEEDTIDDITEQINLYENTIVELNNRIDKDSEYYHCTDKFSMLMKKFKGKILIVLYVTPFGDEHCKQSVFVFDNTFRF
jgi:hypothetical protein